MIPQGSDGLRMLGGGRGRKGSRCQQAVAVTGGKLETGAEQRDKSQGERLTRCLQGLPPVMVPGKLLQVLCHGPSFLDHSGPLP